MPVSPQAQLCPQPHSIPARPQGGETEAAPEAGGAHRHCVSGGAQPLQCFGMGATPRHGAHRVAQSKNQGRCGEGNGATLVTRDFLWGWREGRTRTCSAATLTLHTLLNGVILWSPPSPCRPEKEQCWGLGASPPAVRGRVGHCRMQPPALWSQPPYRDLASRPPCTASTLPSKSNPPWDAASAPVTPKPHMRHSGGDRKTHCKPMRETEARHSSRQPSKRGGDLSSPSDLLLSEHWGAGGTRCPLPMGHLGIRPGSTIAGILTPSCIPKHQQ